MWTEVYNFFRCIPILFLILFFVVLFIIGWADWIKQLRKDRKNTQIQIGGDNVKQEQTMHIRLNDIDYDVHVDVSPKEAEEVHTGITFTFPADTFDDLDRDDY